MKREITRALARFSHHFLVNDCATILEPWISLTGACQKLKKKLEVNNLLVLKCICNSAFSVIVQVSAEHTRRVQWISILKQFSLFSFVIYFSRFERPRPERSVSLHKVFRHSFLFLGILLLIRKC